MTDSHSLDSLAAQHYDRLFRAALFMCGHAETAEDLVQDTFLAAAQSLGSFEGRSSTYTWLYGILRNKFRGWLRRKKDSPSLDRLAENAEAANVAAWVADDGPDVHEIAVQRETASLVRQAVDLLPSHHRDVLVMRYLDHMSYDEISESLGCSLGTVKSRMHYALRRIGELLASQTGSEGT